MLPGEFFIRHSANVKKKAASYRAALDFICGINYLVALSSLFIMEKMKTAERIQHVINIAHKAHKSSFPQKILPINKNLLPTAVANNQPPCINPWKRGGATFETNESPIGLRNNSAIVRTR
jgi:hypothetical protein